MVKNYDNEKREINENPYVCPNKKFVDGIFN